MIVCSPLDRGKRIDTNRCLITLTAHTTFFFFYSYATLQNRKVAQLNAKHHGKHRHRLSFRSSVMFPIHRSKHREVKKRKVVDAYLLSVFIDIPSWLHLISVGSGHTMIIYYWFLSLGLFSEVIHVAVCFGYFFLTVSQHTIFYPHAHSSSFRLSLIFFTNSVSRRPSEQSDVTSFQSHQLL